VPDPATPTPVLVHDYLLVLRGAERTFAAMTDEWPAAPVHTLLYDAPGTEHRFDGHAVHPSPLQRLRVGQNGFRRLLPLFPAAAARLPTATAPLVLSSSSAFAHGAPAGPGAVHVCYCHTPFRYAWHEAERAREELPAPLRPAMALLHQRVRVWDRAAAARLDRIVANSAITRERIARFWDRDAPVVHPPVDVERFAPGAAEDYVLTVGELVLHKQTALALEAARRAGLRVKVVGGGPEREKLEALHGGHAEFLGRVDQARLPALYAGARAFVMPNVEEFGIAAVEAQAAGRPVVAAAAGGALETVVDGETGVLVPPGDVDALAEALRQTDFDRFAPARIAEHARRFSPEAFRRALRAHVDAAWRDR